MPRKSTKKVLAYKNLPSKLNPISIFFMVTCLDYWNAPQWVWVVILIPMAWVFLINLHGIGQEDQVDLFDQDEERKVR